MRVIVRIIREMLSSWSRVRPWLNVAGIFIKRHGDAPGSHLMTQVEVRVTFLQTAIADGQRPGATSQGIFIPSCQPPDLPGYILCARWCLV